jgi:heme-degrading monooxygenase HmoA
MANLIADGWKYLIVWEFRVKPEMHAQFESAYGPRGIWAAFFSRGVGYVATELNRDQAEPQRYITLDFWASRGAYELFRRQHLEEYSAIDATCEQMTESEVEIGCFERYGG